MVKDYPHQGSRTMTTHYVQETTTMGDIGRHVTRICPALDNTQTEHQSHMIEVEGMINKQHITILIYSGANHSYINSNDIEGQILIWTLLAINKHALYSLTNMFCVD